MLRGPKLQRRTQSSRLLPEGCDDEVYMLVQVHADLLGAAEDVLPAYARGEGLLLHLLADALRSEALQTLWPDESAGHDEAGEFVHGIEGLREQRLARHVEIVGVPFYRLQHVLRVAPAGEFPHADHGVLRGVGVLLVVHVVQQTRDPPLLLVFAELAGVGPHGGLDGEHVLAQRVTLRPLAEQPPGFLTIQCHLPKPYALRDLSLYPSISKDHRNL